MGIKYFANYNSDAIKPGGYGDFTPNLIIFILPNFNLYTLITWSGAFDKNTFQNFYGYKKIRGVAKSCHQMRL